MNIDPHYGTEENNDKKAPGEEIKDALIKAHETTKPEDEGPVGPFEHSGETAGWTKTEEKTEEDRPHHSGDFKQGQE